MDKESEVMNRNLPAWVVDQILQTSRGAEQTYPHLWKLLPKHVSAQLESAIGRTHVSRRRRRRFGSQTRRGVAQETGSKVF